MDMAASRRRVVVGVHDSPNSTAALRRAASEACDRQADLNIVWIVPEGSDAQAAEVADRKLRGLVADALPAASAAAARVHVERGDPARTLVQLCAGAELLVIGACTNSDRRGVFAGGVARYCLRNAPCPVDICADHQVSDRT
jgi:nucleotide-binding universal stress UspA family protein